MAIDSSKTPYDSWKESKPSRDYRDKTTQNFDYVKRALAQEKNLRSSYRVNPGPSRNTRAIISPIFPTCIDNSVQNYLNRPDVQSAMHVREGTLPNGKWSDCGNVQYDFNYKSEIPNYIQWTQY